MEQPLMGRATSSNGSSAGRSGSLPPLQPFPRRLRSFGSSISEVFRTATQQPRLTESLDYENVQNQVHMDTEKAAATSTKRHFYGYTGRTLGRFIVTLLTGFITGIVAVTLGGCTELLREWKNEALLIPGLRVSVANAWAWHVVYSVALVGVAGAAVQLYCISAAGAGVAPVMAYLNGSFIPNLLNMKTLIFKFGGTICGCAANLAVGPEGPMVHMGACIASAISEANCKMLGCLACCGKRRRGGELGSDQRCRLCQSFDDSDHREFISAGTACGLAAAFGAPIGGVLFSMEEACSYWSRRVAWRCFLAAMLASFVIGQLHQSDTSGMLSFDTRNVTMTNRAWLYQSPFVAACAMLTGFLGACFNLLRGSLIGIKPNKRSHLLRILEVALVAAATVSLMFGVTILAGSCVVPPPTNSSQPPGNSGVQAMARIIGLDVGSRPAYGIQWYCQPGEYNDLATAFFSSPEETIKHLFSIRRHRPEFFQPHPSDIFQHDFWMCGREMGKSCQYTLKSLVIFSIAYLLLMGISTGLAVPGGMFMPSIMVGAASGGMFGVILQQLLPDSYMIFPGVYALVGATSVLGGVFRASISLVIIMVEGTQGIEFIFGVILAIVVSNYVAEHIHHHGVYESELEQDGTIHFLRLEPPRRLQNMLAREIMASPVIGLRPVESVSVICQADLALGFAVLHAQWFPRFCIHRGGVSDKRVTGLVLRSQLLVLLRRGHFQDSYGRLIKEVADINAENLSINNEMRHFYSHGNPRSFDPAKMDLLAGQVNRQDFDIRDLYVNLRPFMNQAVITVREETSAARCHEIFIALTLRHLCVVDAGNRLVGIITRKDLDRHAGDGAWRLTAPPAPDTPNPHQAEEELARLAGHPGRGPVLGRAYPSSGNISARGGLH